MNYEGLEYGMPSSGGNSFNLKTVIPFNNEKPEK
jgi:hypothetical protein